jgi:hypothetical protein
LPWDFASTEWLGLGEQRGKQMKRSKKLARNLERRRADYSRMISQPKIADCHRDATGYKRPGSNKK